MRRPSPLPSHAHVERRAVPTNANRLRPTNSGNEMGNAAPAQAGLNPDNVAQLAPRPISHDLRRTELDEVIVDEPNTGAAVVCSFLDLRRW
jgi:hypothetical protein